MTFLDKREYKPPKRQANLLVFQRTLYRRLRGTKFDGCLVGVDYYENTYSMKVSIYFIEGTAVEFNVPDTTTALDYVDAIKIIYAKLLTLE